MSAAVASFGDLSKFCGRVVGEVYGLRVFRFFGEALRQSGILIISSKSMVANIVGVHLIGMLRTEVFWGANPRAPIGG